MQFKDIEPHYEDDKETRTIDDIITHNKTAGLHFFDKQALRFFRSRILTPNHWNYFVTSEKLNNRSPRLYTVRRYNPQTGYIDTIGDFQHTTMHWKKPI